MNNKAEMVPVDNLFTGIESNNANDVTNSIAVILKSFNQWKKDNETEKLHEELSYIQNVMPLYYSRVEDRDAVAFALGRFSKEMDILYEENESVRHLQNDYRRFESGKSTNLELRKKIISIIARHEGLSHGELAKRLEISDSSLSNNITNIEKANFITYERAGTHKYYYLTQLGKRYFDERCQTRADKKDIVNLKKETAQRIIANMQDQTPIELWLSDFENKTYINYMIYMRDKIDDNKQVPKAYLQPWQYTEKKLLQMPNSVRLGSI